jgi:hypothetical protein
MNARTVATLSALAVLALAGCGTTPGMVANPPPASTPQTQSVQSQPWTTKTAAQIVQAMRPTIPQVTKVTVWTETTDANQLLGRPNQYTSAASLADKRAPAGETGVDAGATVEVFATLDDAQQRADYIAAIKQGGLMGTEYHTIAGTALLRVTGTLTPTASRVYAAAFTAAVLR